MGKIVLISGKAESGKDSVASMAQRYFNSKAGGTKSCLIIKFGDLLKEYASLIYGWDGRKDEAGRTLLQTVGEGFKDALNDRSFWAERVGDIIKYLCTNGEYLYIFIPDWRFPEELEYIKMRFGNKFEILTVRIERKGYRNSLTAEQSRHISETALDNYDFDFVVDGKDLQEKKKQFISFLEETK